MYEDFFGFDRRPFSLTPDPDFLFWTDQHRRAFDLVCMSLLRRAPIAVITGDVGAGKTTLLQALLREVSADFEVGFLSNVIGDSGDLLRWILTAFGQESEPSTHAEALREVESLLARHWDEGRRSILIIDEAQNVSDHGIETLRLLTNLDVGKCAPLSLLIAGQPELRDRLAAPAFTAFRQRLGASFHLGPMTLEETEGYVRNRMRIAGGDADIFDRGAVQAVYRRAKGVPRLTNLLCDLCLVAAFAEDCRSIDAGFADAILAESLAFGGLGGLPAETQTGAGEVTARLAATGSARVVRVAPASAAAPGANSGEGRRLTGPPSLRVVSTGADYRPERTDSPPLRLVHPLPEAHGALAAAVSDPASSQGAPGAGAVAATRGHLLCRALGSAAGLAVAASLAAVALILPATGTDGGQAPVAAAIAPSPAPVPEQGVAPAVAPPTDAGARGVIEARLAPPDPQTAEILFNRALDEAVQNPPAAAIEYSRAAVRGHGRAAYYLAQMYETGDGVPFAPSTAWSWYALAAGEVPGAEERLSDLAAFGAEDSGFATPVFGAVEGDTVELVWHGQGSFAVELASQPDAATEVVHSTALTAARLELPPDVGWWRVRAVGSAPSGWMQLDTVAAR